MQTLKFIRASLFAGALILSASLALAQDKPQPPGEQQSANIAGAASQVDQSEQDKAPPTVEPASAPDDKSLSGLTVEAVQAALDALEKNSSLDATVKDLLRPKYNQALEDLKTAALNSAKANQYREAMTTAPDETTEKNSELEKLATVAQTEAEALGQTKSLGSDDIQQLADSKLSAVAQLRDNLEKVTAALSGIKLRPAEITDRLPKAEAELFDTSDKLASPDFVEDVSSPARTADRIVLQAREARLQSELEMLTKEQQSQSIREDLALATQNLLTRQLENAQAALTVLQTVKNTMLQNEAQRIGSDIDQIKVHEDDTAALAMAPKVKDLAEELGQVVQDLKSVSVASKEITTALSKLTDDYSYLNSQLQIGGSGTVISQLLFELQDRILRRDGIKKLTRELPKLDDARMDALQISRKISRPDEDQGNATDSSPELEQLLELRMDVLGKLRTEYKTLGAQLSVIERDKTRYTKKAEQAMEFINEQLFWIRSYQSVSTATLTALPGGVSWLFSRENWESLGQTQLNQARRAPFLYSGLLLLIGVLLAGRGRFIKELEETGTKTRRISTDQYRLTFHALLWTLLLALPLPLLLAFLWWTVDQPSESNDWLHGIASGLSRAIWITLLLGFMSAACRPRGLGITHFRWPEMASQRLRKTILEFGIVYVPALLITLSTLSGTNATEYGGNVGRISFILAHLWTVFVLWRTLAAEDGVLAYFMQRNPEGMLVQTRYACYALVLGFPITLIFLAWNGYVITAIELSLGLLATLGIVATGDILYWMAIRWFSLKKRKLALAEALEKRRARREAEAAAEKAEPDEVITVDQDEEIELDLDSISDQTRHLLRMVFGLAVIVSIALFWSETIPIFSVLENVRLPLTKSLTLFSAAKAILVVVVTWIAVRNLPGLLELSVLRTTSIEKGTRYAISRIFQYVLTAIGLLMLFSVVQVDWTQFGWIAAALSVGLGFGLQEVVANSVCGLILLFERPVRLGDVVTLDGMTGTVTKIQMRATTITNWDRQEFIVPNKNLITGTILNWTLSASINRIVIPVGVAYGTDTEKARQILTSVANDHPLVLDEPAPSTNFEQFADSSLAIVLRCYLPDLDNRLSTITELNTEINNRFAAEGIDIAFPQLDLHVRNSWETNSLARLTDQGQAYPS